MADYALMDEAELTVGDDLVEYEEVSSVQVDLEDLMIIMKELDIASKNINLEKKVTENKLSLK